MKAAELKVISFGAQDVIATSICTLTADHFLITDITDFDDAATANKYKLYNSTWVNYGGTALLYSDFEDASTVKVGNYYYKSNGKYVLCDDEHSFPN